MSIESYENEAFGGTSTIIDSDTPFSKIPREIRKHITGDYQGAFEEPSRFFETLASRATIPQMKQWLLTLAECGECDLEYHDTKYAPPETILRIPVVMDRGSMSGFGVSLPLGPPPENIPIILRDVYALIGSTHHWGYGESGGLVRLDFSDDDSRMSDASNHAKTAREQCVRFYENGHGDSLLFDKETGEAVAYDHEGDDLYLAGPIDEYVIRYFHTLLKRKFMS